MTARSLECHGVTGHHIEYHHHHLARIKLNYPPPDPDQSNFQGVTWLSYQPPCYRNNNREARATLSQHSTGRANKTRRHLSSSPHIRRHGMLTLFVQISIRSVHFKEESISILLKS